MNAEHFIYAMFKNYGIKLIKSPGVNTLLTGETINYLCNLTTPKTHTNLWPNGTITITNITQTRDEYGRNGVWNHTIIFSLLDYLTHMQPDKQFHTHFIENMEKPPNKLDPLRIETK